MKYTIETEDQKLIKVLVNVERLADTLYEFLKWRRDIYKGYDVDKILYKGKIYDNNIEFLEIYGKEKGDSISVYTNEKLINTLDEKLADVKQIIEEYYE